MSKYAKLFQNIEKAETITIFSHIFPDGDAIGSLVGLKEAIKATFPNKSVFALGTNVEDFSPLVGKLDTVNDDIIANSLAIIVDVANKDRVEDQRYLLAKSTFLIDHHLFVESFTNETIIDNDKVATCEIIAEFIEEKNMKITPLGATALLLGILTDSGRYSYNPTGAQTLHLSAQLIKKGADLAKINYQLSKKEIIKVRFRGYILTNFKTKDGVCYIVISQSKLKHFNIDASDMSSYVNHLGNIKGYPCWATFAEDIDGKIYVELRSRNINVNQVALKFGGGGHLCASGCRLESFEDVPKVINELIKVIKETKS